MVLIEKLILQKVIAREKLLSLLAKSVISGQEAEKQLKILASELESLKCRRDLIKAQNLNLSNLSYKTSQQILDILSCVIEQIEPSTEIIKLMVKRIEIRTENQGGKRISCCDVYYRF